MPLTSVRLSTNDRVVAGVCAGIAETIGVDPTLVRLVFTLLAFAGGAGIILYVAIWLYLGGKGWLAIVAVVAAAGLALRALGLSAQTAAALVLVACGLALIWRRGRSLRPGASLSVAGLALAAGGVALMFLRGSSSISFLAPGALAGAFLFVIGPWMWQLALERDAERTARIRNEERADVAARVHDSVLQTLALIQKHAGEQTRVASLARRQERELRGWLYDSPSSDETLVGALSTAAADVEELHSIRVEVASGGDCSVDGDVNAVVLAAREAMQNAAKFSGSDEISVYAEADADQISVFVRDRGKGFDRSTVPADRRGLADSIEARMTRAGGTARIVTTLGAGTEIELLLPRKLL